jgi:hypothetical protein
LQQKQICTGNGNLTTMLKEPAKLTETDIINKEKPIDSNLKIR